jgi:predicted phage tail component-like protein
MTLFTGLSLANAPGFSFDGRHSSEFQIYLLRSPFELLPGTRDQYLAVPGRHGDWDFGFDFESRSIELECFVRTGSESELRRRSREIAEWLNPAKGARKLILDTEPDKHYLVRFAGKIKAEVIARSGQFTLPFRAADSVAYGEEKTYVLVPDTPVEVMNNGTTEAFPRFEMEFTQKSTELAIVSNDQYIYFGKPEEVDAPAPGDWRIKVLDDDMSSVAPWTQGQYVDNGDVKGDIESSGTYIRQRNFDYGTGTTWHGAAKIRTLNNNKRIKDFHVQIECGFNAYNNNQVGRLEVYLLNENMARIGKMAIRDSSVKTEYPYVEARAGGFTGGHYFVNWAGPKDYLKDFLGILSIRRTGKKWSFYVGKYDSRGKIYRSFSYDYYDKNGDYQDQLAAVQIHFGAYGTIPAVASNYITHLTVWEENPVTEEPQHIFLPGDKLEVDCASGEILLNKQPFYEFLDPKSTFIRLDKGVNGIAVSPAVFTNGKITFQERWL